MQKLIGCIVIIMLFLIGCSNESSTEKVPSTITLTPLTLFENDEKKYEPFLGPMSGAFKLTYKGDRPNANLNVASWKKGEIVESHNIIFDLFLLQITVSSMKLR